MCFYYIIKVVSALCPASFLSVSKIVLTFHCAKHYQVFNTSNARISVKQAKKQYIYLTNSQQTANLASSSTHRQSYVPSPFFPVCPHNWHKNDGSILTDTPILSCNLTCRSKYKNLPNSYFRHLRAALCLCAHDNHAAVDTIESAGEVAAGRYFLQKCTACRPYAH